MTARDTKDRVINLRLPDELRDEIRAQAHAQGMTMSAYVRALILKRITESP